MPGGVVRRVILGRGAMEEEYTRLFVQVSSLTPPSGRVGNAPSNPEEV
jgi:hypothetical protein